MSVGKTLVKNIIIFGIGSFATKLLQFLLIPLYTRVLSKAEYGSVDILQNMATLLIPIISLSIAEAVFRYTMDKNSNKDEILSIGIFTNIIGVIAIFIISLIVSQFVEINYIWILWLYISTNIIRTLLSQYARAIERTVLYTVDNVLTVVITIIANIVLLVVLKMGIWGYLAGYVIGNIISIIVLIITLKVYKNVKIKYLNIAKFKQMVKFSIPLIPNSICWWIISFADRIMITDALGIAVNGIYAVANKIPIIITFVSEIFLKAWQISANKEFEEGDVSKLYTKMTGYLFMLIFVACAVLMPFSKLVIKIMSGKDFIDAWQFVPVLLLGTAFFSMAQFLGSIYTASKKTKMAFNTNIVAAVLNIVLNIVLIRYMGALGAAVATAICYLVLWIYRAIDINKSTKIIYNKEVIISTVALVILETIVTTIKLEYWQVYSILIIVMILVINYKIIMDFKRYMLNMFLNRGKK